jgi:electron transport complex protein RnfG
MGETPKPKNFIAQAWLVILLAFLYGGALAVVQTALSGRIVENKRAETYRVIPALVPGSDATRTVEEHVQGKDGKDAVVYRAMDADGAERGWVVPAGGQGFADRIEILIGLDAEVSTITGLYVLDQKETPGLGDYITGEDFRNRFRNQPADAPLTVVKSEPQAAGEILALTGATISSESVSGIVNRALANLRSVLLQKTPRKVPAGNDPAGIGDAQEG